MLKDFREFLLRGNLVELAVAVVIGTAFAAVIAALVKDLITPLIAAIGGQPDFSNLKFEINGSQFLYGDFINALIAFLIVAAVVFFLVLRPMAKFMGRMKTQEDVEEKTRKCPQCVSAIPVSASRCAFCTSEVAPAA
jgi:large conductance mechanosensitive channel